MQEPFVIEETKDASRIRALANQCYMEAYKEIHTEEQNRFFFEEMYSLESLHRQMEVLHSRFFIVTGECDMAYVTFYPLEGTCWMLDKLYVHPQYKGRGYGKLLVDHVWQAPANSSFLSILASDPQQNATGKTEGKFYS